MASHSPCGDHCPWTVARTSDLYLRSTSSDADELHEIQEIEFRGQAIINVCEIPLQYKRLGEITVAYGEGKLGDRPVLMVVTATTRPGAR